GCPTVSALLRLRPKSAAPAAPTAPTYRCAGSSLLRDTVSECIEAPDERAIEAGQAPDKAQVVAVAAVAPDQARRIERVERIDHQAVLPDEARGGCGPAPDQAVAQRDSLVPCDIGPLTVSPEHHVAVRVQPGVPGHPRP